MRRRFRQRIAGAGRSLAVLGRRLHAAAWLMLAFIQPAAAAELTARFGPEDAAQRIVLRSTTDLAVLGPVLEAFVAARPGLAVDYEQWGSNPLHALERRACAGQAAPADLVISSAVHHMVALVNAGCAAPHRSEATAALPAALRWRDELWGVTREPAVMVYNRALVPPEEVPRSRFDLLDLLRPQGSRYAGRVATYDIEASGLGFLLAFADAQEATTFGGLMEAFGRSGAVATCCSAEIIDGVIAGDYLVAYNVLGSYALVRARAAPQLGIVAPEDYTLILSRSAMIPRGARAPGAAAALLDYLLSPEGQTALQARDLVVRISGEEGGALEAPSEVDTLVRPIRLSPTLLLALDAHKRRLFIERWRGAFPQTGPGQPR